MFANASLLFLQFSVLIFFQLQDFSAVNHLTHLKFVEDLRRTKVERQQQRLEERIHQLLMSFGKNSSSDGRRMTSMTSLFWSVRDLFRDAPDKRLRFSLRNRFSPEGSYKFHRSPDGWFDILSQFCIQCVQVVVQIALSWVGGWSVDSKEISRLQSTSMVNWVLKRSGFGPKAFVPGQAKLGSALRKLWKRKIRHVFLREDTLRELGLPAGKKRYQHWKASNFWSTNEAHLNDLRFQWKFLRYKRRYLGIIPWLLPNFCKEFRIRWCNHRCLSSSFGCPRTKLVAQNEILCGCADLGGTKRKSTEAWYGVVVVDAGGCGGAGTYISHCCRHLPYSCCPWYGWSMPKFHPIYLKGPAEVLDSRMAWSNRIGLKARNFGSWLDTAMGESLDENISWRVQGVQGGV